MYRCKVPDCEHCIQLCKRMLLFVRNIHYNIRGDGVSCRQPIIKWFQGGEVSLYYCNFLLQQKKKDKERVNGTLKVVENERRARQYNIKYVH